LDRECHEVFATRSHHRPAGSQSASHRGWRAAPRAVTPNRLIGELRLPPARAAVSFGRRKAHTPGNEASGSVLSSLFAVHHGYARSGTSLDWAMRPRRKTVSTTSSVPALSGSGRSLLVRWIIAIVAFPIGGTLGHLVGGPAATVPAALISGLVAGAIIGIGQGVALGIYRPQALALWVAATAVGLGVALAAVTAVIGQIDTMTDAILLGAISGLAIGAGQAALLARERTANAWIWVVTLGVAWAVGWAVTAGVGVALEAGWPVFGLSGALVCQIITGVVLWKVLARDESPVLAAA